MDGVAIVWFIGLSQVRRRVDAGCEAADEVVAFSNLVQQATKIQFLMKAVFCFPEKDCKRLLVESAAEPGREIEAEDLPAADLDRMEVLWVSIMLLSGQSTGDRRVRNSLDFAHWSVPRILCHSLIAAYFLHSDRGSTLGRGRRHLLVVSTGILKGASFIHSLILCVQVMRVWVRRMKLVEFGSVASAWITSQINIEVLVHAVSLLH